MNFLSDRNRFIGEKAHEVITKWFRKSLPGQGKACSNLNTNMNERS